MTPLTPSRSGYTFSPTSRAVTIGSANVSGQNFTGTSTVSTYSISGTVSASTGRRRPLAVRSSTKP